MKKIFFLFVVAALASGCSAKHWCAPASSLGAASAAPGGFIVVGGAVGVCVISKGVEKMVSDTPAKEEKKPEDLGPKRVGPTIQTEQELQAEEAETEQVEVETGQKKEGVAIATYSTDCEADEELNEMFTSFARAEALKRRSQP